MDLQTLRTDTRYLISPQLTSTEYPDADVDRNANIWYKKIVGWAILAGGTWRLGGDKIYRDFKDSVIKYDLPEGLIRILKGEILYETGGSYVPLTFIDPKSSPGTAEGNSTRVIDDVTQPTAELIGNDIIVRPAQSTGATIVNGIVLWVQMSLETLVDDADSILLLDPIVRGVSVGTALDFCTGEEMYTKARELKYMLFGDPRVQGDKGIKGEIDELYQIRDETGRDQFAPRKRSYR